MSEVELELSPSVVVAPSQAVGWLYAALWEVPEVRKAHDDQRMGPPWSVRSLAPGRMRVASWNEEVERILLGSAGSAIHVGRREVVVERARVIRSVDTEELRRREWPDRVGLSITSPFNVETGPLAWLEQPDLRRLLGQASWVAGRFPRGLRVLSSALHTGVFHLRKDIWRKGWLGRASFGVDPEDAWVFGVATFVGAGIHRAWGMGRIELEDEAARILCAA